MSKGLTIITRNNTRKRNQEDTLEELGMQFEQCRTIHDLMQVLLLIPEDTKLRYSVCSTRHDYIVYVDGDGNAKRIDTARDRMIYFSFQFPLGE